MKYIMPFIFIATAASCGGGGGKSAPPEPPVTNSSPIAVNDTASTNNGQVITINVLSNDSDANNDALSLTNVSQPSNGTVRIENNALVYTPSSASFAGTETFNYEVSDQQTSASAQVQVNVSQYTSFNGVVAGADALNSSIVRMTIGDEVFETQLDTQNQFAFDYETTNVNSRAVVFSVFIADKMIYTGTPVAFDDIVSQRGTDVLFSFESHNQLILSPLSTAIEALTLRFDPDTRRALEEQIDADMLLQLAALTSLIAKEELTIEGDILSALSNDDLLTSMAQSLLLEDESVSLSSENVLSLIHI